MSDPVVFGIFSTREQVETAVAEMKSEGFKDVDISVLFPSSEGTKDVKMAKIDVKEAAGFLLAGAVVGAAVALLYAPQSGVRTRKDIRRVTRKTVDRLDDFQGNIRDQVSDWVDDMTVVVKDGVAQGKKLSAEGYEQVLQGFDNAKKYVEDGKSRIAHLINKSA